MNSGKKVIAVLAGAATAVFAGILFAPHKGTTTRRRISKKSKQYADALTDRYKASVNDITKQFKTVKKEAGDGIEKGKRIAEKVGKVVSEIPENDRKTT